MEETTEEFEVTYRSSRVTETLEINFEEREEWLKARRSTIASLAEIQAALKVNFTRSNYTRLSAASAGLTGVSFIVASSLLAYFSAGLSLGLLVPAGMMMTGVGAFVSVAATVGETIIDRQLLARTRELIDIDIQQTSQLHNLFSLVASSLEASRDLVDAAKKSSATTGGLLTRIKSQTSGRLVGRMFIAGGAAVDLLELIEAGENLCHGSVIVHRLQEIIDNLTTEMELVQNC